MSTSDQAHAADMVDGLVQIQQGEYADAVKAHEPVEPTPEQWKLRALAAEEALLKVQSILNVARKLVQALDSLDQQPSLPEPRVGPHRG